MGELLSSGALVSSAVVAVVHLIDSTPVFAVAGVTDSKAPDLNLLFFFFLCLVVLFMIADLILLCF